MEYFLQGFVLQASLILALGAQNLYVLESGLKRNRHYFVAFICSLCDIFLIILGVLGFATIFLKFPILKTTVGLLGVIFLFLYGAKKIKGFFLYKEIFSIQNSTEKENLRKILLITLGFSLLNPHVYLDTVLLIGGYSTKFPALLERLYFGFGAGAFSILWFFGLSTLASSMHKLFRNPKTMRFIFLLSGLLLVFLSFKLARDLFSFY